jgi:hypothetical protein
MARGYGASSGPGGWRDVGAIQVGISFCSYELQVHHPSRKTSLTKLSAHATKPYTPWGGLVGGRGHRKGQLRVLGSPSALRTKGPRTGGPPGGRGPDFFAKAPWYISEGTKTGLWARRACSEVLATSSN